jgi:hypothetical protein
MNVLFFYSDPIENFKMFQTRVAKEYDAMALEFNFHIIDSTKSIAALHEEVINIVSNELGIYYIFILPFSYSLILLFSHFILNFSNSHCYFHSPLTRSFILSPPLVHFSLSIESFLNNKSHNELVNVMTTYLFVFVLKDRWINTNTHLNFTIYLIKTLFSTLLTFVVIISIKRVALIITSEICSLK